MKLSEAEIIQLLPTFMHDDYFVRMLAAVESDATAYLGYAITLATKWDKIDEMTDEFLDALAAELDIDWYLYDTDIDRKRAIIKDSCYIHSIFGTREAVQRVLDIYFGPDGVEPGTYGRGATITEWWEPGFKDDFGTIGYFKPLDVDGSQENNGNCYCFAVTAPEDGLAHGTVEQLFEVVKKVKNVRSHLTWGYTKYGVFAAVIAKGFVCTISGTGAYLCSDTLKCSSSVLASGTFGGECVNVFGPGTPTPPGPEPPPLEGTFTVYHLLGWHGGQTVSNRIEGATVTVAVGGETYTGVTDGAGDCVIAIPDVETVDSVTYSKSGGIWIDTVTHPEGLSAQYPEIRCYVDAVSGTVSRKQILKQGATVTLTCSEAGIEAPTRTATTNENGVYTIENVYGCDYDAVAVVEGVTITKTFSAAAPPHRTATLNFSTWG